MEQNIKAKALLLYSFLGIYCLTALGTLGMLFFGFGEVRDSERALLINTFLVETAVAIGALFYSVWEIRKKEEITREKAESFSINSLENAFQDKVIPVGALQLPTIQLHENKHFKRCKFVGPSAIGILGGNFSNTGFLECGDVIALPNNVNLAGLTVLKNCTVDECEFIRISIFCDQSTAKGFRDNVPGVQVKGLL